VSVVKGAHEQKYHKDWNIVSWGTTKKCKGLRTGNALDLPCVTNLYGVVRFPLGHFHREMPLPHRRASGSSRRTREQPDRRQLTGFRTFSDHGNETSVECHVYPEDGAGSINVHSV